MRQRHASKTDRNDTRQSRRESRAMAAARPLLPQLPQPTRYALGFGLLLLCLWLPAFASLFRQ